MPSSRFAALAAACSFALLPHGVRAESVTGRAPALATAGPSARVAPLSPLLVQVLTVLLDARRLQGLARDNVRDVLPLGAYWEPSTTPERGLRTLLVDEGPLPVRRAELRLDAGEGGHVRDVELLLGGEGPAALYDRLLARVTTQQGAPRWVSADQTRPAALWCLEGRAGWLVYLATDASDPTGEVTLRATSDSDECASF